jgi:N-formylglutamate amidohydrolase
MDAIPCEIVSGHGPLVAVALHDGHALRREVADMTALDEGTRLREEDPFTGRWAAVGPTRMVATWSRFEFDLNRPRAAAVYSTPDDAWGLNVWKHPLSADVVERSLRQYDAFYESAYGLLTDLKRRFGRFVVLDLHSYNHRRAGPGQAPADQRLNPEVNIGTGSLNREIWGSLVDRFIEDLRNFDYLGRRLDVRENTKFFGGHFSRWTHENFPESGCSLSIEFKKFFMDEWTGVPDAEQLTAIAASLNAAVPGVLEELGVLDAGA